MSIKQKIIEWFFPWLRLQRIQSELDAEERIGAHKMEVEAWNRQAEKALADFYKGET
jgi:hypothetical protein